MHDLHQCSCALGLRVPHHQVLSLQIICDHSDPYVCAMSKFMWKIGPQPCDNSTGPPPLLQRATTHHHNHHNQEKREPPKTVGDNRGWVGGWVGGGGGGVVVAMLGLKVIPQISN